MPPLPLLRLPQLILCEVFKSLSIGEKINLSLCSKKVSIQINNARLYSQKVYVHLDMYTHKIEVHSENGEDSFEIFTYPDSRISQNSDTQQFYIAGCSVPVISIPTGIKIFWKNRQEGCLSVIRHLLKIFQCKFSIDNVCNSESYSCFKTTSELFNLQVEFKKLTIYLRGSEDEHLWWNQISNKFGLVETLEILTSDLGFNPVFTSWPQHIDITNSAWFTLEHFLACTCTSIILFQSHLESMDLDAILKTWKAGKLPNLNFLWLHSLTMTDNGATILGMNSRELNGMVIQTDDGSKKARINAGVCCIEMSVTPSE
ncbi:hypothetical protein CRE_22020 [Caenorhabditis remanei]|uniref:F-box domain-containing protein n=1 Tax=Caenorhabditis remanei TaxID=31234 RepID=E3N3F3_CAERE|nr:hypothetical protein CRE_22020 [Caenorhabditis remanei]